MLPMNVACWGCGESIVVRIESHSANAFLPGWFHHEVQYATDHVCGFPLVYAALAAARGDVRHE